MDKDIELRKIILSEDTVDNKIARIKELFKRKPRTDQEICTIIEWFRPLNAMIDHCYKSTTQRNSVKRLLNSLGPDKIHRAIVYIIQNKDKPWFPTITTPYELELKWGKLIAWAKNEKDIDRKNNSDLDYYRQKQKEFNRKYKNYINE